MRDSNQAPPEYKSKTLQLEQACLGHLVWKTNPVSCENVLKQKTAFISTGG
jgi:hypothetical protein